MSLAPFFLLFSVVTSDGNPVDRGLLQACRQEMSPLVRLACYDALGNEVNSSSDTVSAKSATWLAIQEQESARVPDSAPFLLRQEESSTAAVLTRPALRGATLAIGCVNSITHIRLRLDAPWRGESVEVALDGQATRSSQSWFIRDQGWLLEYGRGLPAIEELKRWIGHRELQVKGANSVVLQVDLNGLKEALLPLRQLCRW
ncbi:MAG: type VI secretion system-associated protein VasI [Aeromonas veronii]